MPMSTVTIGSYDSAFPVWRKYPKITVGEIVLNFLEFRIRKTLYSSSQSACVVQFTGKPGPYDY